MLAAALRVLGNVVSGDDDQTQQAVDSGALDGFVTIIRESTEAKDRKEAFWSLS
eukprot:SAG31_NODE_18933_length_617_cov_1.289575_1_plen_53_part_10